MGKLYTRNDERFPDHVFYGDIVSGLPLDENSCQGVFASHVLEHLPQKDVHNAIRNTYSIMRPGGIFRLVVPDLEIYAKMYIEALQKDDPSAAHDFMRGSGLGSEEKSKGLGGFLKSWLGHSKHLWMWDFPSLNDALSKGGFTSIRRCQYGDCDDPAFKEVENPERFVRAVAVEARK